MALIENWTSSWTNGSVQGLVIVHEIDGMGFVVVNGQDKARTRPSAAQVRESKRVRLTA